MLLVFVVLLAAAFAFAAPPPANNATWLNVTISNTPSTTSATGYTSGTGLTGYDVLGAHNNGGRGCAGCHAPHSGAAGGGGNAVTGGGTDNLSGSNALFGQDVSPLFGVTLTFALDGGIVENLPSQAAAYTTNTDELRGIMMCLACHDGAIAKGQMMNGVSWEQRMNLLPSSVYGPHGIPTLLGNDSGDGNVSGYGNDHPVGTNATFAAAGLVSTGNPATDPLKVTFDTNNGITAIAPQSAAYVQFALNYGYPAIAGTAWDWGFHVPNGATDVSTAFMTCTTCHNQHVMYIYKAPPYYGFGADHSMTGLAKIAGGTYPTYFFVNGPYNPGAGNNDPTKAASTTQFCRQCHFDTSNESLGVNSVQTQF